MQTLDELVHAISSRGTGSPDTKPEEEGARLYQAKQPQVRFCQPFRLRYFKMHIRIRDAHVVV